MSSALTLQWTTHEGPTSTTAAADPLIVLPRTGRRLGGEFSAAEAAGRLSRFFGFHHGLMRALAGRITTVAQVDLKIELAHHTYLHAEACSALRDRVGELRGSCAERADRVEAWMPLFREIEAAPSTPALILGVHETIGRRLLAAEINYALRTDALADQPSLRALSRIAADLEPAVELGAQVLAAFREAGWSPAECEGWIGRVRAHLSALGGIAGDDRPTLAPSMAPPYRRPSHSQRDARFNGAAAGPRDDDPARERPPSEHERERLALICAQRDRKLAMETFANLLYDLPDAPFAWQMDLARFLWDEARHAEIGRQALIRLGHDPFDLPAAGRTQAPRGEPPPGLGLEHVGAFVEFFEVDGKIRPFVERAYAAGDRDHAMVFDFIHGDEMLHLHRGGAWRRASRPDTERPDAAGAARLSAPAGDDLEETLES